MKKVLVTIIALSLIAACFVGFAGCGNKQREGVISIRNLYFENWSAEQGDSCVEFIQDKFGVKFETSTYSFENWSNQVNGEVMGNQLPDVFQANVTSYNFANYYTYWADGAVVKPLPDDLSKWPNLKSMIDNTRDIEYLKYKGKLYGIPIARNINKSQEVSFAPFTYMYRRDVAKKLNVYKEGDIYTWDEFNTLLAAFKTEFKKSGGYALGDAEWGYPSILNYYKTAPHCFAINDEGEVVNNYATPEYMDGLAKAKEFVNNQWYYMGQLQASGKQNIVKKEYTSKRLGIFYENLSLQNYLQIRDELVKNGVSEESLDDYTAIIKVQGLDGTYALEGQEDWFSMTFFNYDISDTKMEKVLDIMDWLLSEEGTMMALYGIEGVDYEITTPGAEPTLLPGNLWEKNNKGQYIDSPNGARYLRYMVTLGHDIIDRDPLVQKSSKKAAYDILNEWELFMSAQKDANKLKVLFEDSRVKWMQTTKKLENAGKLLDNANSMVLNYTFGEKSINDYRSAMSSSQWNAVLSEINKELNK